MKIILFALLATTTCLADEFRPRVHRHPFHRGAGIGECEMDEPDYNVPGWKRADGTVEHDVFKVGDVITLTNPAIESQGDKTRWKLTHDALDVSAEMTAG